jgi:hypothetical protein
VERGQVRELQRLHDAAGVTAASDEVAAGHHVVRQIAASGTPVPPAPPGRATPARHGGTSRGADNGRHGGQGRRGGQPHRGPRVAAGRREGSARREGGAHGTAQPGRRSQRPQQPHGSR